MTQEKKAKAYDKVREKIAIRFGSNVADEIFSQFEMSEDERIRKDLLGYLHTLPNHFSHNGSLVTEWIAWLEKQGEQTSLNNIWHRANETPQIKSDDRSVAVLLCCYRIFDVKPVESWEVAHYYHEYGFLNWGQTIKENDVIRWAYLDELIEKQGKQKPADKVEPKFKIGDWVVTDKNNVVQIKAIEDSKYVLENTMRFSVNYVDKCWRKWTIQDAKDGEVLYECNEKKPFIFKELETKHIGDIASYCDIFNGIFTPNEDDWTTLDIVPATKEQRDLLFQKMKEAGYVWDAEKKELKKIEQKPAWSEEDDDDAWLNDIISKAECNLQLNKGEIDFLKSLKGKIQPRQEWSEEDDQYLLVCKNALAKYQTTDKWDASVIYRWLVNKVKSLRPKNTWKPSEEQMLAINTAINVVGKGTLSGKHLIELQEQLKKLRKEEL